MTENFSDVDIERLFALGSLVFRVWMLVLMTGENTRQRLLVFLLVVFLPIICGLHVAVFGVSSYYMEKFKPGGGWCSVFVEKTNKEKKTRKRIKIFIKSVDTDTETY